MAGSKFDYVAYDDDAQNDQTRAKELMIALEAHVNTIGYAYPAQCGRAKALAITKLEEAYMWIGKAIRDEQIARNGSAPLQEERTNS